MKLLELSNCCGTGHMPPSSVPGDRLNLPCCDGQTLLGNAADRGDVARIRELIARGADPNGIDLHGQPPLIVATLNAKGASVRELLEHGASPDAPDNNGRTALMYALYLGHLDVAETLKSNGASQSVRDLDGRTAADYAGHKAAGKDMKSTVDFVKGLGVDPKTVKAKLSPMRSDPDFVALEYVKRLSFLQLLRLAVLTWISLAGLAQIGGLLRYGEIHYVLVSILEILPQWALFPVFYSAPLPFGYNGFGWAERHPLFVAVFGWTVPFVLLVWPILRRQRIARKTRVGQGGHVDLESAFSSITASDSAARGVANILKHGGREAFARLKEQSLPSAGKRIVWFLLTVALLVPYLLGLLQNVLPYLDPRLRFFWLYDLYVWVPLSVVILLALLFGLKVFASYVFSRVLITKQNRRNVLMSERLDGLSEGKSEAGDYILYLRAFSQDGAVQVGNFDLEAVLAYSFSEVTDVVALGDETRRLGPVELRTDDDEWEERVLELAKGARFIIMVPAATESVAREVEILKANGLLAKCVFIAPPENKTAGANLQSNNWAAMLSFGIFATLEIPPYVPSGFLFRLADDGRLESWDALGLQLEPPPIVAGVEFNDGSDSDFSSDFDPSISDGGWESGSLSDVTAAVMAQEQAAMDQSHAHHMHMQNDDLDDHHHL